MCKITARDSLNETVGEDIDREGSPAATGHFLRSNYTSKGANAGVVRWRAVIHFQTLWLLKKESRRVINHSPSGENEERLIDDITSRLRGERTRSIMDLSLSIGVIRSYGIVSFPSTLAILVPRR